MRKSADGLKGYQWIWEIFGNLVELSMSLDSEGYSGFGWIRFT